MKLKLKTKSAYDQLLKRVKDLAVDKGSLNGQNPGDLLDALIEYEEDNGLVTQCCNTPHSMGTGCSNCEGRD